jgi:hypothetical protein
LNDTRLNVPLQSSSCWGPDIIAVEPQFNDIARANTAIKRWYTGSLMGRGPGSSAQGRYLVWSDIANNRQMRWSEDDWPRRTIATAKLRLSGPTTLLRASHPPRSALRARRHGECDRRFLPRQAAQPAERRRTASDGGREIEVPTWPSNLRRLTRLSLPKRPDFPPEEEAERMTFAPRRGPTSIRPAGSNVRYRMNQQAVFFVDLTS